MKILCYILNVYVNLCKFRVSYLRLNFYILLVCYDNICLLKSYIFIFILNDIYLYYLTHNIAQNSTRLYSL